MLANLKAAIEIRWGSQVDFATDNDFDPTHVSQIVRERRKPTPAERERMAKALNADAAWLFRPTRRIPPYREPVVETQGQQEGNVRS